MKILICRVLSDVLQVACCTNNEISNVKFKTYSCEGICSGVISDFAAFKKSLMLIFKENQANKVIFTIHTEHSFFQCLKTKSNLKSYCTEFVLDNLRSELYSWATDQNIYILHKERSKCLLDLVEVKNPLELYGKKIEVYWNILCLQVDLVKPFVNACEENGVELVGILDDVYVKAKSAFILLQSDVQFINFSFEYMSFVQFSNEKLIEFDICKYGIQNLLQLLKATFNITLDSAMTVLQQVFVSNNDDWILITDMCAKQIHLSRLYLQKMIMNDVKKIVKSKILTSSVIFDSDIQLNFDLLKKKVIYCKEFEDFNTRYIQCVLSNFEFSESFYLYKIFNFARLLLKKSL